MRHGDASKFAGASHDEAVFGCGRVRGNNLSAFLCEGPGAAGDGAMGALAGVLVGGPIGLVAGGVVGYTTGPAIASSWGLKGHRHYRHVLVISTPSAVAQMQAAPP